MYSEKLRILLDISSNSKNVGSGIYLTLLNNISHSIIRHAWGSVSFDTKSGKRQVIVSLSPNNAAHCYCPNWQFTGSLHLAGLVLFLRRTNYNLGFTQSLPSQGNDKPVSGIPVIRTNVANSHISQKRRRILFKLPCP